MKIPIFCSLIPVELVLSCGHEVKYLDTERLTERRSGGYQCAFHDNLCSYVKVIYDYLISKADEFDLIIVPTSCDAMKKLYIALKKEFRDDKVFIFDVPHSKQKGSVGFIKSEMRCLYKRLGNKISVDPVNFLNKNEEDKCRDKPKIAIAGANVPTEGICEVLSEFGFESYYVNHCLTKFMPDNRLLKGLKDDIDKYAECFITENGCPRTVGLFNEEGFSEQFKGIDGIIWNGLKFCDFQHFDYNFVKKAVGDEIPIIFIESDLTSDSKGQTLTRIEAFIEKIVNRKKKPLLRCKENGGRYYLGVDSGSHATKMVCVDSGGKIVSKAVTTTGTSVEKSSKLLLKRILNDTNIDRKEVEQVVATGYGRKNISFADRSVTEISCHGLGVGVTLGREATIVDIGGQDSKAIKIDKDGKVLSFVMNDKCAAGTGRFLEVMASKLEISIEDFARLSLQSKKGVPISSMCSVFAESEVISLIASGQSKVDIAKGVHNSIASRTIGLIRRIGGSPPYYMTGGVAMNRALIKELEDLLGSSVTAIDEPQFSGAYGAAIIARRD